MLGNFWKLYDGKLLETICWEIFGNYMMGNFWKLYAGKTCDPYEGNLLMETMCWEIRVDAGGFLMGLIMGQCYGITPGFQGNGARS